jgi:hypothetical protein
MLSASMATISTTPWIRSLGDIRSLAMREILSPRDMWLAARVAHISSELLRFRLGRANPVQHGAFWRTDKNRPSRSDIELVYGAGTP